MTVSRAAQRGRVSWPNIVLKMRIGPVLQDQAAGRSRHFFRANLERKRYIWPAAWCSLHSLAINYLSASIHTMSLINNNRIKTHISAAIREHLDVSDCGNDEAKVLSRSLASIYISSISGLSYKDSAKYVTDGGEDQGIDGCYYDANKNRLHLVQTKWSSAATKTIDTGSIHKFIAGTYLLLDLKWNEFNSRFKKISAEIEAGLSKDPQIVLVVVYNSDSPLSGHAQKILDKFLLDNNSDEQDVVTYSVFGLSKLVRAVQAAKSGARTDVELGLLEWGETKEPFYAITGKVCCADVAEWHKSHGELLFSENIRYTLSSSEINQRIAETLIERPAEFWYLNNGITAIAGLCCTKPVR